MHGLYLAHQALLAKQQSQSQKVTPVSLHRFLYKDGCKYVQEPEHMVLPTRVQEREYGTESKFVRRLRVTISGSVSTHFDTGADVFHLSMLQEFWIQGDLRETDDPRVKKYEVRSSGEFTGGREQFFAKTVHVESAMVALGSGHKAAQTLFPECKITELASTTNECLGYFFGAEIYGRLRNDESWKVALDLAWQDNPNKYNSRTDITEA